MNSAEKLFEELQSLKQDDDSGKSPEKRLLEYCKQALAGIEHYHVDLKEKHDRTNSKLADNDKKNLAKAISGFANSGGGVLIWGIEDKSLKPKHITDVKDFVSWMLRLAAQATDPPVDGTEGDWIPSDAEGTAGFGLLYVPESLLPPHRVILKIANIKDRYFQRSGESFIVASHAQLEDMFRRRPRPELSLSTDIAYVRRVELRFEALVILAIENRGRGVAKSPFLAVTVHEPYDISPHGVDEIGTLGLTPVPTRIRSREYRYGSSADVVIHSGDSRDVTAVLININVTQPQYHVRDLVIDYRIAAEGVAPFEDQLVIRVQDLLDYGLPGMSE